jgi:uncharacterized repeat protein (TIGR02543 family)
MQKKLNQFRHFSWILVMVASLLLLSACTNRNEYTIKFESNGGSAIEDITFNINDPITKLPEPTKEGYVFSGWYLDEGLNEAFDIENINDKEIILYAKWSDSHLVSITYDAMGGSSDQTNEVKDDEIPLIYAPIKEGYVFLGWYFDQSYQNVYIFDEPLTEDTTLYAKWEERSDVVLSIIYNDELIYEFNIIDGQFPELSPTVPDPYASKTTNFYKDQQMRSQFNDEDMITSSSKIYARLSDAYYVYYDQVEVLQPDQYITPTEVIKDGKIYELNNMMYDKTSHEMIQVYRPSSSFYQFPIDFKIESIEYFNNYLLIETTDGKQYLKNKYEEYRPNTLRDVRDLYDLHEGEKIEQKVDLLYGNVVLTSEKRVIYIGSIFLSHTYQVFESLDITEDISLSEGETLCPEILESAPGYGFKTSSGRVFAATEALLYFDVFNDLDQTKIFTEVNSLLDDQDQIITLSVDGQSLFYLTSHGHVYYQNLNSKKIISYQMQLEDGEVINDFFKGIIFTSHHRYFEMQSYDYYQNVTETKFNNIVIDSKLKNEYLGVMFIQTIEDEIYLYTFQSSAYVQNVTEGFDEYNLLLEDVRFYDDIVLIKNDRIYSFKDDFSIYERKYGFISTYIDGPYDEGDEVKIKTFESEMYNIKGYDSVSLNIESNQISMPSKDLFMRLIFESQQSESLFVSVDGRNHYIDYVPGDEITYEDIEHLIPNAREIDLITRFTQNTKVEFPIKTSSIVNDYPAIYIYTKPKEDAITLNFNIFSNSQYFGTETFYASYGDTMKTYVKSLDYYGFNIEGIYQNQEMTIKYNQDEIITKDTDLYVRVSIEDSDTITIHVGRQTFYLSIFDMFYLSKSNIAEFLSHRYQVTLGVIVDNIYLNQEKTILVENSYMIYESTEIWVDLDLNYKMRLYEVDAFNEIRYITSINYDGITVSELLESNYIRDLYKIDRLFLDKGLTQELFAGDEIPYRKDQLFYKATYSEGIETTIHMYDQDGTFIETLTKVEPMSTASSFLSAHGYSDIKLFTDSDFEYPLADTVIQGQIIYGKATLDYVTIHVINPVTDMTYNIKHPSNLTLMPSILTTYLQNEDAGYLSIVYYEDEALTKPLELKEVEQDMTIYVSSGNDIATQLVTFHMVGDVEFIKEVHFMPYNNIRSSNLRVYVESLLELSHQSSELKMFSDPELTIQIDNFIATAYDVIYVEVTLTPRYKVLVIDPDTDELIWNVNYDENTMLNLKDAFSNAYNTSIPFKFHKYFIYEYYLDQALTIPVESIHVTEDITVYIKEVPAAIYTITYQFTGIELDDFVLSLTEKESINHRNEVYRHVLKHVDLNVYVELIYPTIDEHTKASKDVTVIVEVLQTQYYEVEFIYEFDGEEESEVHLFKKGDILEDSLFFGKLFEDPNSYDVYFYKDAAMTDGALTVVVDQDMTLYLKVVRKY